MVALKLGIMRRAAIVPPSGQRRVVVLLAVVLGAILGGPAAGAEVLTLDVMTYNIFWGGQDRDPAHPREDEWFDLIVREAPDVICLQECNGWLPQDEELITHYVDMLNAALPGHPPYHGIVGDARSLFDLALITRYPVLGWEAVTSVWVGGEEILFRHACLHVQLDLDGERHHVLNCHFAPGWENRDEREAEARAVMQLISELPAGEMVWAMGDFNSYSPVDCDPESPTQPDYAGGAGPAEMIGWEPVSYLLEAGFVDGFRELYPLDLGYTKAATDFFVYPLLPVERIDFIFGASWTEWAAAASMVLDDDLGDLGSDHYAVLTRYQRPPAAGIDGEERGMSARIPRVLVRPNPVRLGAELHCRLPAEAQVILDVLTVEGRLVQSLRGRAAAEGTVTIWWDGTDQRGGRAPTGTYYVRPRGAPTSSALLLLAP